MFEGTGFTAQPTRDGGLELHAFETSVTIPMGEFMAMVRYVLTNSDLEARDPRLVFVRSAPWYRVEPGWNEGKRRLVARPPDEAVCPPLAPGHPVVGTMCPACGKAFRPNQYGVLVDVDTSPAPVRTAEAAFVHAHCV